MRLMMAAIGQELVSGSPWVSVNKRVLAVFDLSLKRIAAEPQQQRLAA